MGLSVDLIDQFIEATKDEPTQVGDGIAYGTVMPGGVQLDGSDIVTPATSTVTVNNGDRVIVLIKNHAAVITGNYSDPAANGNAVVYTSGTAAQSTISGFLYSDGVVAETITSAMAEIDKIEADEIAVEYLDAIYGNIGNLSADLAALGVASIDKAIIKELTAQAGYYRYAQADYADFAVLSAKRAEVGDAIAKSIKADVIVADALKAKFADMDEVTIDKLLARHGIIKYIEAEAGVFVKELAGVKIKGDLIQANTLQADSLIVRGENGIYYKLNVDSLGKTTAESDEKYQNGLDGSVIVAKSIAAEKLSVDDLIAFEATIAGFTITDDISTEEPTVFESGMDVVEGNYYTDSKGVDRYLCIKSSTTVENPDEDPDGDSPSTTVEKPTSLSDTNFFKKETCIGAIYSGVKASVDNGSRGVYLDNMGQVAFGDSGNYVRFYKDPDDEDGSYKLAICAKEIFFTSNNTTVDLNTATNVAAGNLSNLGVLLDKNSSIINTLNDRIELIAGSLNRIVTGKDGTTLMTQTDQGYEFKFYDVQERLDSLDGSMSDALEHRGHMSFGETGGKPHIVLQGSENAKDCQIKMKLDTTSFAFLNERDEVIGSIVADTEGRAGLEIDNATVSEEFRQSNKAVTGEFVWQVRRNGNYGLSWKG